jgi:predicted transcriptional regulator
MTINLKNVLARAETWSEQDQEELAQMALEIEARRHGLYHASPEELKEIDAGLAEVERGEIASHEEVEAVFAKFRRP